MAARGFQNSRIFFQKVKEVISLPNKGAYFFIRPFLLKMLDNSGIALISPS